MKTILVVCPTERDRRELKRLALPYTFIFYDYDERAFQKNICGGIEFREYDFRAEQMLKTVFDLVSQHRIDGLLFSRDYPGPILASIVAQQVGLKAPDPCVMIGHQHKYYSRCWQRQHVPDATPWFQLLDPDHDSELDTVPLPLFLKPVKSFLSMLANEVRIVDELRYWVQNTKLHRNFLEHFNWFVENYTDFTFGAQYLLGEEVLSGEQCTLEGFICDGQITILGVTDSIMFPGTICFKRFEYPSSLSRSVQNRMASIAKTLMKKTGFDNGFFNIEYMYNPKDDRAYIIEVNPRAASQFADLYEKVDGTNTYQMLAQLAVGEKPSLTKRKGLHKVAASCVLRTFENKRVAYAPSVKELETVYKLFPDARVQCFVKRGDLLSDAFQDGKSYRYALIHLGAQNWHELQKQLEICERILNFQFEPV